MTQTPQTPLTLRLSMSSRS